MLDDDITRCAAPRGGESAMLRSAAMPRENGVVALAPERAEEASLLLGRAFRDNPGMRAILAEHSTDQRLRAVSRVVRGFVDATLRAGDARVVVEAGHIAAVALAYAPGRWPASIVTQLIIARGPLTTGLRSTLRFARADRIMRKRHPHRPNWYLLMLGVEPELQGKGLGSRLLAHHTASAGSDGVECYLETDKLSSVRLYERHGYVVTTDETFAALGQLRLWTMTRPQGATVVATAG